MSSLILTHEDILHANWRQDADTGLILPPAYRQRPKGFDFFAGCGGFSLGFIRAGYEIVGALDINPDAAHTYLANLGCWPMNMHFTSADYKDRFNKYLEKHVFAEAKKRGLINMQTGHISDPELIRDFGLPGSGWINTERMFGNHFPPVRNFWLGDIREITGEAILEKLAMKRGELDVVMGGPPCQGYSTANKSKPRGTWDPRNDLVFQYARMIVELSPKTFVMEEVPEIANYYTPHGVPVIEQFIRILEEGGYGEFQSLCHAMGYAPKKSRVVYREPRGNGKPDKPQAAKKEIPQPTLF